MEARSTVTRVLAVAVLLATGVACDSVGRVSGHATDESAPAPSGPRAVTALGRLQPKDGIIRVAGPSRPTVVIAKLLVETGDVAQAGQPLAILGTQAENEARDARRLRPAASA